MGNGTIWQCHQISVSPTQERPTEPNAGFLKYAPGAFFPLHRHDFAQVWYIIEGEFTFAGNLYGPGTIAFMPDPHFEHEMHTATGGTIFFVQYSGSDHRCATDL
jgi:anti-sigma factor ChrR (cupin superfamily)